ncbi:MAG: hypothetical protein D8M26_11020 [Ignavibacteriae bacterium]|nr:hypothetical protein [Ignavibacteriota bacterium]
MKSIKTEEKYFCPHHQKELVLRQAKHGVNRGTKFWSCPTWNYTACNYTIPFKSDKRINAKDRLIIKITNKKGKINPLKIVLQIFLIPIYLLGVMAAMTAKVFSSKRKMGL